MHPVNSNIQLKLAKDLVDLEPAPLDLPVTRDILKEHASNGKDMDPVTEIVIADIGTHLNLKETTKATTQEDLF